MNPSYTDSRNEHGRDAQNYVSPPDVVVSKQENVGQYQADTYRSVFRLCSLPLGYKTSVSSHSSKLLRYAEFDA